MELRQKRAFFSKVLASFLAFVLITTSLPLNVMAAGGRGSNQNPEAKQSAEIVSQENRPSGLVGFEGEYELSESDRMVSVIVEFAHQPATLVQAIAEANGERAANFVPGSFSLLLKRQASRKRNNPNPWWYANTEVKIYG